MTEEIIGGQRLILGDCLDVLPLLAAGSVDAVITDPPYGIPAYQSPEWHDENRGTCQDVTAAGWDVFGSSWMPAGVNSLSERSCLLAFGMLEDAGKLHDAARASGLNSRGTIVWVNTTPIPRGARPQYQSAAQAIVWAGRPGCFFLRPRDGRARWNVIEGPNTRSNTERAGHPTQKPIWLMQHLLEYHTVNGQTVLDPFMGSGTTLVAAELLGRRGIGIEIDPGYFEIACRRVEEAVRKREQDAAQLTLTEVAP